MFLMLFAEIYIAVCLRSLILLIELELKQHCPCSSLMLLLYFLFRASKAWASNIFLDIHVLTMAEKVRMDSNVRQVSYIRLP